MRRLAWGVCLALSVVYAVGGTVAEAAEAQQPPDAADESTASASASSPQNWNLYGQFTNVTQWHDAFSSPYQGANSLNHAATFAETSDATLFFGARLWSGAGLYVNPELDEGFGLSNTLGVAGFPSGEAYKIGANAPYWRIPRAFIRQVINLSGATEPTAAAANQLAGASAVNNLTLTLGKFSVVDVFDTNTYAHDPRGDFLNWTVIDSGAFDYAADSWGFTYGGAAEWSQDWWTARLGLFDLSTVPNGKQPDPGFGEFETVAEFEARHTWGSRAGKIKLLLYANRGNMGAYADALALARQTASVPSTALVRHFATKPGIELNVEQALSDDVGWFARLGASDGRYEAYEFTEVNRSISTGVSSHGASWGRNDDVLGVALVENQISADARAYFAAGGLGILIGDGRLNYGPEEIAEAYYALQIVEGVTATLDLQRVDHPAYNRDRGPVSIAALRLHAEF